MRDGIQSRHRHFMDIPSEGVSAMKRFGMVAWLVYVMATLGATVFAQSSTISGTVADSAGALIPGVAVTATNTQTGVVTIDRKEKTAYHTVKRLFAAATV